MTRTKVVALLGLAALPAARLGLDALADAASSGTLLLVGLAVLGTIAVIAIGVTAHLALSWQAPAALAYAGTAAVLAVVPPYDERTTGFVAFSILLFTCAIRFATRWTGRQADAPVRATRGARAASTTTWVLAALGVNAGVVIVVVNVLVLMVDG